MILFTNNVENYVENSEKPWYDWVLYVENSEKTIISTLYNYMLQKQQNYKRPKTAPEPEPEPEPEQQHNGKKRIKTLSGLVIPWYRQIRLFT